MQLESRIKEILQLEKFSNLTPDEKDFVCQNILANCLILSKEIQDRYLNIIRDRLAEIINLHDSDYIKDGICYGGIVESKVTGPAIDFEQTTFPYEYYLKYQEQSTPLGRMTKSCLHEFGHLVVKKDSVKLSDDIYLIDMGGLVISKLFKDPYGHMMTEVLNEFTNFLSYKSSLVYSQHNEESNIKMKEYAERMGFSFDDSKQWLKVLPDDLFSSYTEEALSSGTLEDGTERMFNQLYVKYTPLVRLMMCTFQNPLYSYDDLKEEFEKGNGLSAKRDNIPINDLFYGYYESSMHVQELFDSFIGESNSWENFCLEFDSKMADNKLDVNFIARSIDLFTNFYQTRLKKMIESNQITGEAAIRKAEEFKQVTDNCIAYYESIKDNTFR